MSDNVINKINIGGSTYDIIGVPDGGTAGQVLTKNSETDYDVSWEDAEGGGITPITYSELVELRDNGELIPGMQYRITDYECTTSQINTQSAGHVFDIIVTADSENTLNENARAAHHINTISYQIPPDPGDNTGTSFTYPSWMSEQSIPDALGDFVPVTDDVIKSSYQFTMYDIDDWFGSLESLTPGTEYSYVSRDSITKTLTFSASDTYFANCNLGAWELKYSLDNDTSRFTWADTTNGKGVIYYMKDEWNNECPYDFKNIQFKRWSITDSAGRTINGKYLGVLNHVPRNISISDETDFIWAYTFSSDESGSNSQTDLSLDKSNKVYDNIIKPGMEDYSYDSEALSKRILNGNVLYGSNNYENRFNYRCRCNTFCPGSNRNKFGIFSCDNISGNNFAYNVFMNGCSSNSFGTGFQGNSLGNDNSGNSFMNNCTNNSFLNNCNSGSFGNNCSNNTFSENVRQNTYGNDLLNNSFGESFVNNTVGNSVSNCSFGSSINDNTFGNYLMCITVFDGVYYCNIVGGSDWPSIKRNAHILNGTHGTSKNSKLTINFTANQYYTQIAGLVNGTTLRIWIAEDTVTGPSTATNNHIAVFNGTTGKIIKDSGITISDLSPDLCTSTTYSALKTLRDGGNLVPGMQYRITDYTCTTTQANTSSAGHVFDIIVTADDTSTLNENARAAHHSGDTYYQNCNLEAWELKYTIDNDTDRFGWANSTNGKGIVYWMKDENRNEACYDFTNILFNNKYTFNNSGADARLNSTANIHDNIIGPHYDGYASSGSQQQYYTIAPNNIVFEGLMNYDNTFGEECYDLTFSNMTIGNEFDGFTWDCSFGTQTLYNKFGSYCTGNVFPNKFATSTVESHCWYMNVTSTTNYTRCHLLGGIQGTSTSNRLNVPITETHQYAGLNSSGVLKTWIPADLIQ